MRDNLLGYLQHKNNLSPVFERLEQLEKLSERERTGLRSYLQILSPRIENQLSEKLSNSSGGLRRLLLEILLGKDSEQQRWKTLLEEFGEDSSFLMDLLTAARNGGVKLPQKWLLKLVDKKNATLQIEALMTLAVLHPQAANQRAEKLLTQTEGAVQRAVVEILCKSGETGLQVIFSFIHSSAFRKLPYQQQESIFRAMGQIGTQSIINWFQELLEQKSHWMRGQIDRFKQLAIQGLQSNAGTMSWGIIEESLKKGQHSKSIKEILTQAFQSRIYSSEFQQYTHENPGIERQRDE